MCEQQSVLQTSSVMELPMPLPFVATMAGVRLIYIAVAALEFGENAGLIDDAGTAVVGQRSKEVFIFAILFIEGTEFTKVFA